MSGARQMLSKIITVSREEEEEFALQELIHFEQMIDNLKSGKKSFLEDEGASEMNSKIDLWLSTIRGILERRIGSF